VKMLGRWLTRVESPGFGNPSTRAGGSRWLPGRIGKGFANPSTVGSNLNWQNQGWWVVGKGQGHLVLPIQACKS